MENLTFIDHIAFVDRMLCRRYVFALDKSVNSDELHMYLSKLIKNKQALASFDPDLLNHLYLKIPDEIASEFNVGVTLYVCDNQYY